MPLITDYQAVSDVYDEARELGVALPVFCAEDRETLESILASALKMGREIGVDDLPITPAWTCRYPSRPQMKLVSACGDPVVGTRMMLSDLDALMGETSPYRRLRVLPHLDHAIPWLDADILKGFPDRFASVMCDASEKPFAENIEITARYVESVRGRVVVEGCVDEIFEAGGQGVKNEPSTVAQVQEFLSKTGVDLAVPNVGTEHRLTAGQAEYRADRAREIGAAVGKVLCLHGTSSVAPEVLPRLPEDGFIKINIYTTLAVRGGQALAGKVLGSLRSIFDEARLSELVQSGVLGAAVLRAEGGEQARPRLDGVANPGRRDAWFAAVRDRCCEFLELLKYRRYAS